jgi:hypothetical protein
MKSLVDWLQRLSTITGDTDWAIKYFRVAVPGIAPLDVTNWVLSIDPQGVLPRDIHAISSESFSLLRLPDVPQDETKVSERHRLSADLACLLSLASERKVVIPVDYAIAVPQLGNTVFNPLSHIVDQGILGPLPMDSVLRLKTYMQGIAGLPLSDQEVIGAAASAHHGALLTFDREPRAAYALLVAGIETLSRAYGQPPTDWNSWEYSGDWDTFFVAQGIDGKVAIAIRERLLHDKHLRLGATFRNYASVRLKDDFWEKSIARWVYGTDANTGDWLPAINYGEQRISDLLPNDRNALGKALGRSYALRSSVVHEADWIELLTFAQPTASPLANNRPLPFPILRLILAELIWLEVSSRSKPVELPNFQLLRHGESESNDRSGEVRG